MVCSVHWERLPFYRSERWLWRPARVVVVAVVPGRRRGKGWAHWVSAALVMTMSVIVARQRVCGDGELDGNAQHRGGSRR